MRLEELRRATDGCASKRGGVRERDRYRDVRGGGDASEYFDVYECV